MSQKLHRLCYPEIVRSYEGGMTIRELGDAYNVSHERIAQILRPRTTMRPKCDTDALRRAPLVKRAHELRRRCGWSDLQIAEALGVSDQSIHRWLGREAKRVNFHELLTAEEWRMGYCEEPYPSTLELERLLGMPRGRVIDSLRHHGIPIRSRKEQSDILIAQGKHRLQSWWRDREAKTDNAARVLEALKSIGRPAPLSEIARAAGMDPSTARTYLIKLREVEQCWRKGPYRLKRCQCAAPPRAEEPPR